MYLRARYYDPKIGRFISRDPYAGVNTNPLSLNRYTYVENNPANAVDPSGKFLQYLAAGILVLGWLQVGFIDNAQVLSDDGVGGESDAAWLYKVGVNTTFQSISHRADILEEPLIGKGIVPSYPRLGRPPTFGSNAWWFGARQRVELGSLLLDQGVVSPLLDRGKQGALSLIDAPGGYDFNFTFRPSYDPNFTFPGYNIPVTFNPAKNMCLK